MHIDDIHVFEIGGEVITIVTNSGLQNLILNAIPKDHYKKADELALLTGCRRRTVMRIISELRELGAPIISSRKGETGIKLAKTQQELKIYTEKTASRIRKEYIGISKLKRFASLNLTQMLISIFNFNSNPGCNESQ